MGRTPPLRILRGRHNLPILSCFSLLLPRVLCKNPPAKASKKAARKTAAFRQKRAYPFAYLDIAFGGRRLRNKRVGLCLRIADNNCICGFLQRISPDLIDQIMEATNFLHQRAAGMEARRTYQAPAPLSFLRTQAGAFLLRSRRRAISRSGAGIAGCKKTPRALPCLRLITKLQRE